MPSDLFNELKCMKIKDLRVSIGRFSRLRKLILRNEDGFNYAHVFGFGLVKKGGNRDNYFDDCDSIMTPASLYSCKPTMPCGTTACIGGWAYFQGRKEGKIPRTRSRLYAQPLPAAGKYLGLRGNECEMLFFGQMLSEAGIKKREEIYTSDVKIAVRRIDACIRIRQRVIASIKNDREKAKKRKAKV